MKTIVPMQADGTQLFEELMRFLPDGMTANAWAVKAGVSRTVWADLRRHGNPSRRTLEKLLAAAGSSLAEFEALRVGSPAAAPTAGREQLAELGRGWRGAPIAPIPLLATGLAGEWGEAGKGVDCHSIDRSKVVGRLGRPAALAADAQAYAVTMVGKSMWPRFRSGRQLLVSPDAQVAVGDDVLVELAGGQVLIKELVSRSASMVELRQFNPDVTFEVTTAEAVAVHKVVGEPIVA
jgi:phage repressor protein C with HTH and peptisase S24 domain